MRMILAVAVIFLSGCASTLAPKEEEKECDRIGPIFEEMLNLAIEIGGKCEESPLASDLCVGFAEVVTKMTDSDIINRMEKCYKLGVVAPSRRYEQFLLTTELTRLLTSLSARQQRFKSGIKD